MADEFVYAHVFGEQGPNFAVRHRIVKRTKTRLYVDRQIFDNGTLDPKDTRCFTLDRAAFERDGCARGKRFGGLETYYVTEERALIQR